MKRRYTKRALYWITDILERKRIQYVITGGFAAHLYGSRRRFNDIDIGIHRADFPKLISDIRPYLDFGPGVYRDRSWVTYLATLTRYGREIELVADNFLFFDARDKRWRRIRRDFSRSAPMRVLGKALPVMTKAEIISIKQMLRRRTDLADLKYLLHARTARG